MSIELCKKAFLINDDRILDDSFISIGLVDYEQGSISAGFTLQASNGDGVNLSWEISDTEDAGRALSAIHTIQVLLTALGSGISDMLPGKKEEAEAQDEKLTSDRTP